MWWFANPIWNSNPKRYVSHEKVYKECNNEAFYFRGAPAALVVGSLTTFAAMSEKISPGRFGYLPKILAVSGVAFILGKLTYGEQCTQKFLQMESTKYGNQARIIREARGMPELIDPNIAGYFLLRLTYYFFNWSKMWPLIVVGFAHFVH